MYYTYLSIWNIVNCDGRKAESCARKGPVFDSLSEYLNSISPSHLTIYSFHIKGVTHIPVALLDVWMVSVPSLSDEVCGILLELTSNFRCFLCNWLLSKATFLGVIHTLYVRILQHQIFSLKMLSVQLENNSRVAPQFSLSLSVNFRSRERRLKTCIV
jgi:hypothetical protein